MKMTRRLPSKGLEKGCSVLKYVKGVPFFSERYTKRVPFLSKMVYKRVRVGPQGGVSPYKTLLSDPPPPPGFPPGSSLELLVEFCCSKLFSCLFSVRDLS